MIEKSNIEADLMQLKLPGSEIANVFSGHKWETGAACSNYLWGGGGGGGAGVVKTITSYYS